MWSDGKLTFARARSKSNLPRSHTSPKLSDKLSSASLSPFLLQRTIKPSDKVSPSFEGCTIVSLPNPRRAALRKQKPTAKCRFRGLQAKLFCAGMVILCSNWFISGWFAILPRRADRERVAAYEATPEDKRPWFRAYL